MSLVNYRKASTEKLQKALSATQGKFKKDERYWEITTDKEGTGSAVIRFLDRPIVDGDEAVAVVSLYTHNFKGPGGWYIENSLTTLDQQDPVSEYNSKLWATGLEANQSIARAQKRKLTYISNILVVKDPTKPENNGKVFLYKYGKKIYDKIFAKQNPPKGAMDAEGDPIQSVNVFDLWEGCNFLLSCNNTAGSEGGKKYRNYDDSVFSSNQIPIAKTDAEIEHIISRAYSLKGELKFKTYDELKKKLDRVLAFNSQASSSAEGQSITTEVTAEAEAVNKAVSAAVTPETATTVEEEDNLDFFKNMMQDAD